MTAQREFVVKVRSEPAGEVVKPVTYHVEHRIVRSDGSRADSGAHEFRGGKRVYFESLENDALKDRIRTFMSGWIRLYLTKSVKLSHIIIHRASVGNRSFKNGEIKLEVQGRGGHWQTILLRKGRAIDRPLSISKPGAALAEALADIKGVRANCKTRERRLASPLWPLFTSKLRSMEPPCSSFSRKNGLKVGLPLIHPEFCNWLVRFRFKSSEPIIIGPVDLLP